MQQLFKRVGLSISLLSTFVISAQDAFVEVDTKTYNLYMAKEWKQLLNYGHRAIKEGIDYYYLRTRVGIAAYELKKYYVASRHFTEALRFNEGDELMQEYLYYSYTFTNRFEEANKLSKQFSAILLEKLKLKPKRPIDFVVIEGGTKLPDKSAYQSVITGRNTNTVNPAVYTQVGVGHSIKKRLSLFHALTYFGQNSYVGNLTQGQYYVKVSIPLKNGWQVSPAGHYLHQRIITETIPSPPLPGMPPPKSISTTSTSNIFVGALTIRKQLGIWNFGLSNTVSNMFNKNLLLHGALASCAPLGNTKIVLGGTYFLHTTDAYVSTAQSFIGSLQVQPIPRWQVTFSYLSNAAQNIVEENGYLVNNAFDLTNWRAAIFVSYQLNSKWSVYATGQLEDKTEGISFYNYRYTILVAGIKITP